MLIRLRGTTEKIDAWTYKLNFDIPVLYLDDCTDYNIGLRMILLDLNFTDHMPTSQFWSLQTTAVDKSAVNPKQEIASFPGGYKLGSDYSFVYYEPHLQRDYKIKIKSFHSTEYFLVSLKPDDGLEIDFVEVLLDVSKYDRI